jgi:hypothetical protein
VKSVSIVVHLSDALFGSCTGKPVWKVAVLVASDTHRTASGRFTLLILL